MPFGSEFHLPRLRQSLYLPSGIGMAFSGAPFSSEFHLSRLRQSLYLPSGIGMAFLSNLIALPRQPPHAFMKYCLHHDAFPTNFSEYEIAGLYGIVYVHFHFSVEWVY